MELTSMPAQNSTEARPGRVNSSEMHKSNKNKPKKSQSHIHLHLMIQSLINSKVYLIYQSCTVVIVLLLFIYQSVNFSKYIGNKDGQLAPASSTSTSRVPGNANYKSTHTVTAALQLSIIIFMIVYSIIDYLFNIINISSSSTKVKIRNFLGEPANLIHIILTLMYTALFTISTILSLQLSIQQRYFLYAANLSILSIILVRTFMKFAHTACRIVDRKNLQIQVADYRNYGQASTRNREANQLSGLDIPIIGIPLKLSKLRKQKQESQQKYHQLNQQAQAQPEAEVKMGQSEQRQYTQNGENDRVQNKQEKYIKNISNLINFQYEKQSRNSDLYNKLNQQIKIEPIHLKNKTNMGLIQDGL